MHAGCPEKGRLSTLHAFDVKDLRWKTLAPAPDPGRGGTALIATKVAGEKDVLLRYGGMYLSMHSATAALTWLSRMQVFAGTSSPPRAR